MKEISVSAASLFVPSGGLFPPASPFCARRGLKTYTAKGQPGAEAAFGDAIII
jgi:hypothetical protein